MPTEQSQQAGGWTRESLLEDLEEARVSKLGFEEGDCIKTMYHTQMEGMSGTKAQRSAISKSQGEGW